MCVMLEMKENPNIVQFETGDCHIMMDLGAGTADIVYIEIIFDEIFQTKSGEKKMRKFQATHPTHYLKLLENIENGKQRFFNNKKTTGTHKIEIPYEFSQFMQENISGNLEKLVSNFKYLGEFGSVFIYFILHSYDGEDLLLSCELWIKLFDLRIDPIIKKMDEMLKKNEKILSGKLKCICLVGGFSQSPYLQHKLKQHYESKYKVVMPKRPVFSVVQGAAQLARIPFITSRIVKYTYGTGCGWSIEKARSHPKINEDYINKYKFINNIKNKVYISCFRVFVNKDKEVKVGQMIEQRYSKESKEGKNIHVTIYRSEEEDPGAITRCKHLVSIKIPYPKDFDDVKDRLYVRFCFGETLIRVTITVKGKEYVEHEVQIKYDFDVQHLDAIG
ncbi:hypothetical protein RFI_28987 [Reticulomyxa filosa]|uniref:Uncharacterized protein n=1 Tax=Reticulomyxa filosa TaxID=46433 RepID=X6M5W2_RETFI|nr:hypothetical protein RFI_28987 [Reticulomyxa filosa]|eukprot:ETO08400.1 hypothetical protein RFI_28987 [Reticulomyxa filosa]